MEDLITILIIVIGVAVKIHGAMKKNRPAEDAPVDKEVWQELFGDGSTVEPFAPVQEKAPVETPFFAGIALFSRLETKVAVAIPIQLLSTVNFVFAPM